MRAVRDAGGKVLGEPMDIPGIGRYVSFFDTENNRNSMLQPNRAAMPCCRPPAPSESPSKLELRRSGGNTSAPPAACSASTGLGSPRPAIL